MIETQKVMVVGAGFMGAGISQAFAEAGFDVRLNDTKPEYFENAMSGIAKNLNYLIKKEIMDEARKKQILGRIVPAPDLTAAADCDLVIEAVFEEKEIKQTIFGALENICPSHVIFATNTSSFPITELATYSKRPEKFIGMHFFSPVNRMKLVEIVNGLKTSRETTEVIQEIVKRIDKIGVIVKDGPGFLVNRISAAMRAEVYNCLAEGVASIEDIDMAIKFGLGHPMGPFELSDFTGLDIGLAVAETLSQTLRDPKWRPSLLLRKLVISGDLGRKTGKGWYDYTGGEKRIRTDINL